MRISLLWATLENKINRFYLLSLVPLAPIAYFLYVTEFSVLGVLIPFYGFLLFLLKKDKLSISMDPLRMQRFLGVIVIVASFAVFYVIADSSVLFAAGAIFYAVYVLGLFLVFFNAPAFKESFSAVFLIVAGGSSYYIAEGLKNFIQPFVPFFVPFFVFVLIAFGISARIQSPNMISLSTSKGLVPVSFEAGCLGIYSFLVFSIIAIVTMLEEPATRRAKLLWSFGGVIGTFLVNTFRVSLIAVVIYYFGYENWGEIHSWIGYALFLLWLLFFLVIFSKREAIGNKAGALLQKF